MREAKYTNRFKKDLKRQIEKRQKDKEKIIAIIDHIRIIGDAPERCRPHNLSGNFIGRRECHIEPDWLLIYAVSDTIVDFYATGTYSDLF